MLDIRFKKYKTFKDVQENDADNEVNLTGCIGFVSFEGHRPCWTKINARRTGVVSLDGLKEGLKEIYLDEALSLTSPVGLPASCQIAFFNDTSIERLQLKGQKMTEGLRILSLSSCKELKSLEGMPDSCLSLYVNKTNLKSLEGMSQNVENISAAWCPLLETTKGLSGKCKKLNLDWSGVKVLEDIPEDIQEIRLYGCYALDVKALAKLPASVLSKIKGLTEEQQKVVDAACSRPRKIFHHSLTAMPDLTLVRA